MPPPPFPFAVRLLRPVRRYPGRVARRLQRLHLLPGPEAHSRPPGPRQVVQLPQLPFAHVGRRRYPQAWLQASGHGDCSPSGLSSRHHHHHHHHDSMRLIISSSRSSLHHPRRNATVSSPSARAHHHTLLRLLWAFVHTTPLYASSSMTHSHFAANTCACQGESTEPRRWRAMRAIDIREHRCVESTTECRKGSHELPRRQRLM